MRLFSIGCRVEDKPRKINTRRKPIFLNRISSKGIVYGSIGATATRSNFEKAEYNLGEISKVLDIEAYVRQAVDKHVEMCLKESMKYGSLWGFILYV